MGFSKNRAKFIKDDQYMKIDLHCHSKYSQDNYLEPEEVIEQAIKMNLDGVCFTEH